MLPVRNTAVRGTRKVLIHNISRRFLGSTLPSRPQNGASPQIIRCAISTTPFSQSPCTFTISALRQFSSYTESSSWESKLPEDVSALVQAYAAQNPTSVSLDTLLRTGRGEYLCDTEDSNTATERVLMQVAGFLRRELPVRLAHRIQDLDQVPLLREMPSVKRVKETYVDSFLELSQMPPVDTAEKERAFGARLEDLYEKHANVLVDMARGAFELRKECRNGGVQGQRQRQKREFELMDESHAFLDRFYMSRIGIRVLAGQYLALRHEPPTKEHTGLVCNTVCPYESVNMAIADATTICDRMYGDAPEVVVHGRPDLSFPYIETHLHYILLELIKNSMRATMEWHGVDADYEYPPVSVTIADGSDNEDVVIKVSDEGGGIPRSNVKKIWSYLFTTADPKIQERLVGLESTGDHSVDSPLAGLGYGLPISRSYARYFGGDLSIMSMEGYGTDAFVYLTRLRNSKEHLVV